MDGSGHTFPAGHMTSSTDPSSQNEPSMHASCAVAFLHTDPAAQTVGAEEPSGQKKDGKHGVGAVEPAGL